MEDHQELALRLEEAARRLREMEAQPNPAFELSKALPAELGALWSRSPQSRNKAFRSVLIDHWVKGLQSVLDGLDWHGRVVVARDSVLAELDGVRMHADRDMRFFRKSGRAAGASLLGRLQLVTDKPERVIDIGANIGEISLFYSRSLPDARIVAVEASSENIVEFERNRTLQTFPTDNLQLIHAAVADREGTIDITVGAGDMNTVLVEDGLDRLRDRGTTGTEQVRAITLDTVIEAAGGGPVDLIKIDIEGAEPLLGEALARHAGKIKMIFVEFSVFNTLEAYIGLNDRLLAAGYRVFDAKMRPIAEMAGWLAAARANAPSVNIWYVRSDLVPDDLQP
jgi:FkbM family methyltransferase